MQSVRSYFNPTLFKKNMVRFWPIWGVYLLIWTLILPVQCLVQYSDYIRNYDIRDLAWFANQGVLDTVGQVGTTLAFFFGLLCAMAVFSYLFNNRSSNMMHTLPLRREGFFITNVLSGLTFMLGPHVAVLLLTLAAEAFTGHVNAWALVMWCLAMSLICIFFFGFAVFCAMFTGHILALPAFYGILNFLVVAITQLLIQLLRQFLYGFYSWPLLGSLAQWLTPVMNIYGRVSISMTADTGVYYLTGMGCVFIYAFAGFLLLALALVIYRRRDVERAGDVVVVAWVRPIFKYGVAFCSALVFGVLLATIFAISSSLWAMLPLFLICGAGGYFAAEMLLQKSFRVFRKWKGCALFLVCVTLLTGSTAMDVFGFQGRVPALEQLASVSVSLPYSMPNDNGSGGNVEYTDPEELSAVRALHQALVDLGSDGYGEERIASVTICYRLNNGMEINRRYDNIPVSGSLLQDPDSPAARLDYLINLPKSILSSYAPIGAEDVSRVEYAGVDIWNGAGLASTQSISTANSQRLYEAVVADLEAGDLGRRYLIDSQARLENCWVNDLTFTFQTDPVKDGNPRMQRGSFTITPQITAKRTMAVLEELGLTSQMILWKDWRVLNESLYK